jgi:peptidylprolyl isomerase
MGWLQRRSKIIVLGGIIFLVVSLGAGTLFATSVGQNVPDQDEPEPTATASATGTAEATATPDENAIQREYDAAPPMSIDVEGTYEAIIHLEGDRQVRVELFASDAPGFVNNFVFLAENRFFEGLQFHRVLPGFVAQAGDPDGDTTGGPGYWLTDESNSIPLDEGMLAMAKAGAQVSGSQFFITLSPQPVLKEQGFTAFGQVVEGFEHIESLTPREPVPGVDDQPPPGDIIESIEIIEGAGNAEAPEGSE